MTAQVAFELKPKEIWQFTMFQRPVKLFFWSYLFFCLILIANQVVRIVLEGLEALPSLVAVLFTLAVIPPFFSWTIKFSIRRMSARNPELTSKRSVELTPEGIKGITLFGEGTYKWAAVQKIVTDGDLFYIFVATNVAYVIPKRAFPSTQEAEAFLETARRYWKEAGIAPPPVFGEPIGK